MTAGMQISIQTETPTSRTALKALCDVSIELGEEV